MRSPIPKKVKDLVKNKFGGKCGYCGQIAPLVIDHIIPVCQEHSKDRHGLKDINEDVNLMPACQSCNNYKNTMTVEMLRNELQSQVSRARARSVNFRLAERFGLVKEVDKKIEFYFENPCDTEKGE